VKVEARQRVSVFGSMRFGYVTVS